MATKRINISEIERNPTRQPREGIVKNYVTELKDALTESVKIPPIIVYTNDGRAPYYLADGWHRTEAHEQLSMKQIEAEVLTGGSFEAFVYSLGANREHGLRRTNADKRRAVTLALSNATLVTWSDRRISEQCGVSNPFVTALRAELLTVNSSSDEGGKTVGRDGKKRATKKAKKPEVNSSGKKEHEVFYDETGYEIPDGLTEEWQRVLEFAESITSPLIGSKEILETGFKKTDIALSEFKKAELTSLKRLISTAECIAPYAVCPTCAGHMRKKCKFCNGRGFISKYRYETAVSKDVRAMREKGRKK